MLKILTVNSEATPNGEKKEVYYKQPKSVQNGHRKVKVTLFYSLTNSPCDKRKKQGNCQRSFSQ